MSLLWQSEESDTSTRRSSRLRVPATDADAVTDSDLAERSHAAEDAIADKRRSRKEIQRADAEDADPPAAAQASTLPDSALKDLGATSCAEQFAVDLLRAAAELVLANEGDMWMAAFKPVLPDVPSAAVIQLSKTCITALHKAHAAGQQFSTPDALVLCVPVPLHRPRTRVSGSVCAFLGVFLRFSSKYYMADGRATTKNFVVSRLPICLLTPQKSLCVSVRNLSPGLN